MFDSKAYLARIHHTGPTTPTPESLRALHLAHLYAVPFENLDISLHRPITCDEHRFFHKIVELHRGGFCYELNGAFAAYFASLGFGSRYSRRGWRVRTAAPRRSSITWR